MASNQNLLSGEVCLSNRVLWLPYVGDGPSKRFLGLFQVQICSLC